MTRSLLLGMSALLMGLVAQPRSAHAQSFRLDRFRAAEHPLDGFGVRRLDRFGHVQLAALLTADYAHDPLTIERSSNGREVQSVVDHQLTLALGLSLGLWERLLAFASLEAVPLMRGPEVPVGFVPPADAAGLGDVAVGARVRLLGGADDLFALGVQAALLLPTAGTQAYRGEERLAARPELIAELRPGRLRVSFNVGSLVRARQRLVAARLGSELVYGAALGVRVLQQLELLAELTGGFGLHDFGARETTDVEWRLGAKYASGIGLYVGAAAGTGFTSGVGSPDARVIGQLGYRMPRREQAPVAQPAPPPQRSDADGDGDGVPDVGDACPAAAEDRDEVEDGDGCPELDDDRDGVPDAGDACDDVAEDADHFDDGDGCPEPDNDQDGVLDAEDACPDAAGVAEERGCAAKVMLTEQGSIEIAQQILFATDQAEILPDSHSTLAAVASTLAQHPEIAKLRVEGHTDDVGPAFRNLTLSQARARAVVRWLGEHGIAAERLVAYGCGEQHPVAKDQTEAGRARNRRVVFRAVAPTRTGGTAVEVPKGCQAVLVE